MTYDLSKGHTRTMGVAGGVNKRLSIVAAALAAAVIGGIWASILNVDPLKLSAPWEVWTWLGLYAFPALVAIIGLFLLPLYFMILRPAGHKDATVPVFAVFGAAAVSMVAGLLLVSGPRALRDYDVFKLEDAYVRATQKDINEMETSLARASVPVLTAEGGGDPLIRAQASLDRYNAEVTAKATAFRARRIAVRRDISARLGDTQAARERMLRFDRQAATSDRVVEKFWDLRAEYGVIAGKFLSDLRNNRGAWDMDYYGVRLRGGWGNPIATNYYEMSRVQRDMKRVYIVFRQQPFIDRRIK
ncbi:hypothetical protein [Caulobacter sp. NIBR1757]|uniref:hypothetical protein n=1 Tax=Caulobacter sp. NIBR1757 TaxID=3016000 RepID=UPI0022F05BF1|nr:hypothetical protein [Caulobacter sp. NIBR1757]WGM38488.1 hypothetical protein AMEJIAPC_01391 [Caulobacter sp. NIBR1757]